MLKGADEVIYVGIVCRLDDFFIRCIRFTVTDVFHDCTGMQPCILQYHAKAVSQFMPGNILCVDAVNIDVTTVELIEAHQQFDNGCFTGTGRSDNGDLGSGFDIC